jgi:putative ABC transport system permease protein
MPLWPRRGRWERQLDAEVRFHLESRIDDLIKSGLPHDEAERQARREFGSVDLTKDECRDYKPVEWLAIVSRDVRHACRFLARSPAFTATAIITMALGLGANAAIVGVVYSTLIRPLPYPAPQQLYAVDVSMPDQSAEFPSMPVTVQLYRTWREAKTAFSAMATLTRWECSLTGDGEPERLGGAQVSTNFFDVLGPPIQVGRAFRHEEEQPGRERVVVISDALWRRRYGSDPGVLGRTVSINGQPHTVIGVASPRLLVPTGTQLNPVLAFAPQVDLWRPFAPTPRELENESWDQGLIVRLRPGDTPERGQQQLQAMLDAWVATVAPGRQGTIRTRVFPLRDVYAGQLRPRLLLVFAASLLLLGIASVNLVNLMLARLAGRSAELSTRVALGASRMRLLTLVIAETGVVTILGGTLGAIVAHYGARLLMAFGPEDIARFADDRPVVPAFLFAVGASVLTGVLSGLIPARQAHPSVGAAALQEGGRSGLAGPRVARSRQLLVGVEIALVTMLLASAGLLLHSFVKLMGADRGYDVERVLTADLSLFGQRYDSGEKCIAFYRTLSEQVRALPGVLAAGTISDLPAVAGSSGASRRIFLPTDTDFQRAVMSRPVAMVRSVTTGYFAASGTRVVSGRTFGEAEPAPVAVISESLARGLWPQQRPVDVIGRTIRQGNVTGDVIVVAGVVADVRSGADAADLPPIIYRPHAQWASGPATLVIKTRQEPADVAPAVRAVIRGLDPNLPIVAMRTLSEVMSTEVATRRFQLLLTIAFAAVALALGVVGVYGVVRYTVACRTRDIGLRMALGAGERDIMRFIVRYGMRPVVIGFVVGLGGALVAARVLQSQLYDISAIDLPSVIVSAAVLLTTAGLACYLPARRAARLDPTTALRHD